MELGVQGEVRGWGRRVPRGGVEGSRGPGHEVAWRERGHAGVVDAWESHGDEGVGGVGTWAVLGAPAPLGAPCSLLLLPGAPLQRLPLPPCRTL